MHVDVLEVIVKNVLHQNHLIASVSLIRDVFAAIQRHGV